MEIRAATIDDVEQITTLARAVADTHHDLDPYYKKGEAHQTLSDEFNERLNDRNTLIAVAISDKKIVGYIDVNVEEISYANTKHVGLINSIYVNPPHRRQRVAQALWAFAKNWLTNKKKIQWVELNVDSRNKHAINLWNKLEFETYKLRMRKKLV